VLLVRCFWCSGALGRWDAGTLGRWDAGTLGCRWDAGRCWDAERRCAA
jgi:hypothetical protein